MLIKQQKTEEIPHCSLLNNVLLNDFNSISVAYLKHVHILENIFNICIINDLSYPPATQPQIIRMHCLLTDPRIIRSARGYNRHPRITILHRLSLTHE